MYNVSTNTNLKKEDYQRSTIVSPKINDLGISILVDFLMTIDTGGKLIEPARQTQTVA